MVKALVGDGKIANGRDGVACHLRLLAMKAFSSPLSDVLIHGRPYDFGADGLARAFHARMTEAVDGVKNAFTKRQRNEWPGGAIAYIHDQAGATDVDVLKVESRPRVVSDAAEVRIERLLCGYGIPIDAE